MPTDLNDATRSAQKQILESLEALQTTALDSARAAADIVDKLVPQSLRDIDLPGSDLLPSADQAIAVGFDFAEQLLSSQRRFVEELTAMGVAKQTPKPRAKSATAPK